MATESLCIKRLGTMVPGVYAHIERFSQALIMRFVTTRFVSGIGEGFY
jgi:hypothetical protein